jgi:hypothetical protein
MPRITTRPTVNAIPDLVPDLTTQFALDRNRFQSTILGAEPNFLNPIITNTGAIPKTTMASAPTMTVTERQQEQNDNYTPEQEKEALARIVWRNSYCVISLRNILLIHCLTPPC